MEMLSNNWIDLTKIDPKIFFNNNPSIFGIIRINILVYINRDEISVRSIWKSKTVGLKYYLVFFSLL